LMPDEREVVMVAVAAAADVGKSVVMIEPVTGTVVVTLPLVMTLLEVNKLVVGTAVLVVKEVTEVEVTTVTDEEAPDVDATPDVVAPVPVAVVAGVTEAVTAAGPRVVTTVVDAPRMVVTKGLAEPVTARV